MAEIKRNFFKGSMDKDSHPKVLEDGKYREAQNVSILETDSSKMGSVRPIFGNIKDYADSLSFANNTEAIGYCLDQAGDRAFVFLTNFSADDTGNIITMQRATSHSCYIVYFDLKKQAAPTIIVSGSFLNFNKNKRITGANVIDDLLFWTDDYNQPRTIDINIAINDTTYYDSEDKVSLAKVAPYASPFMYEPINTYISSTTNTLENNSSITSEYIEDKFVRFSYRYKYTNNEYSIMAPFTQHVFEPKNNGTITSNDIDDIISSCVVSNMYNNLNHIQLRLPLPQSNDNLTEDNDSVYYLTPKNAVNTDIALSSSTSFYISPYSTMYTGTYIVKGIDSTFITDDITRLDVTFDIDGLNQVGGSYVTWDGNAPSCSAGDQFAAVRMWQNHLKIKSIEVLIKESNSNAVKVVAEIDVNNTENFYNKIDIYPVKNSSTGDIYWRYCLVYNYKAEKPYKFLPEADILRVNDQIPIRARSQELVSNRIVFGNYVNQYNIPLDESGNPGIKYYVGETLKGEFEFDTTLSTDKNDRALQHLEKQYKYNSIKQKRTYQVGIVLSDKYGRQSPVILSTKTSSESEFTNESDTYTTNLVTSDLSSNYLSSYSWSTHEMVIGKSLTVLFEDQRIVDESEVYHPINNPNGWYSWKLVVKQTEQDYYNVYTRFPIHISNNAADSTEKASYISLLGDNINKVPRNPGDTDQFKDGITGSDIKLYPKVIQSPSGDHSSVINNVYTDFIEVKSIGTAIEQGLTKSGGANVEDNDVLSVVHLSRKNPRVAELSDMYSLFNYTPTGGQTQLDFNGVLSDGSTTYASIYKGLSVFETKPFESILDIYYETSTSGLISDLNESLLDAGQGPYDIKYTSNSNTVDILESYADNALIGTITATGYGANAITNFEIIKVYYGGNPFNDVTNRCLITLTTGSPIYGQLRVDGNRFVHTNSSTNDKYTVIVKVTQNDGISSIGTLYFNVNNSNPILSEVDTTTSVSRASTSGVIVIDQSGDNWTGRFTNGSTMIGTINDANNNPFDKFSGCKFTHSIPTPTVTGNGLTEPWSTYDDMFTIVQDTSGRFVIKTTPIFSNKIWHFFQETEANRTMTITVTDNNGNGLSDTVDVIINTTQPRAWMPSFYSTTFEGMCAVVAAQEPIGVWLTRGETEVPDSNNVLIGDIIYTTQYGSTTVAAGKYTYDNATKMCVTDTNGVVIQTNVPLLC
jgi:hypothetical protein